MIVEEIRDKVKGEYKHPWSISCPVCSEYEGMVCELDFKDESENSDINVKAGVCLECHLVLPYGFYLLNNAVVGSDIEADAEKIRLEYACC